MRCPTFVALFIYFLTCTDMLILERMQFARACWRNGAQHPSWQSLGDDWWVSVGWVAADKTIMETCHLVGAWGCGRTPVPSLSLHTRLVLGASACWVLEDAPEDRDGRCFTLA